MKTLQTLFMALALTAITAGASAQSASSSVNDRPTDNTLADATVLSNVSFNRVYPDPVISNLFIDVTSTAEEGAVVRLVDILGRIQLQKQVMLVDGENHIEVNMDGLANGGYQLLLQTNTQNIVYRLVKVK